MDLPIKNSSPSRTPPPPPPPPADPKRDRRRLCLCTCICCLTTVVVVFLVLLIVGLTLFKAKNPTLSLDSVRLTGVAPSVSFPTLQLSLNLSLHLQISVYNPNRASFSHGAGSTDIDYRGGRVGTAVVAEGRIPARGTALVDVDLNLQSGNFTAKLQDLVGDITAGEMAFDSSSRIPGRVKILGIIRKRVVAFVDCRVVVGVLDLKVRQQECSQTTKL